MPSAAQGRHTREQILDAAMEVASVQGLAGLSIGGLAQRLGISKSGLFRHFGAKERLQLDTVEAATVVLKREVFDPATNAAPGLPRVAATTHAFIEYLESGVFPGGCFFAAAAADVDSRPGPVRDRVAEIARSWIDEVAAEVVVAQRLGQLDEDIDARQLTFELHAYVQEANWARLLLDDDGAPDRARAAIDAALSRAASTVEVTPERTEP